MPQLGGDYGTALQAAAARGHKDIVEYLLGSGVDVNLAGGFPCHHLRTDVEQLRLEGDYGTALCAACVNGHMDVVNFLLGRSDIVKNKGEWTD